jgi:anaphase-promoting complex subunit 5
MPSLDPELSFLQHETYIDYLISTSQFPLAYQCISSLAQSLKEDNADVQQRISVLLMQAELWTAVGCLGAILNTLGEYREAKRLIEAVLPQVC